MDRTTLEQDAPPGAGIVPMSLGGTCPGHRIERGPKRGATPAFCAISCGTFDPAGTLKPAAVRLPPGMEWGCVNWRGHQANVADLPPAQKSQGLGGCESVQQHSGGVSSRAGEPS